MSLAATSACRAEDWYRWRGPDLNGISKEIHWQSKWPDDGPKRLWKASVGTGMSSLVVSRGRVYTLGNANDTDTLYCFDANTGATLWKHSSPCKLDPNFYEGGPSSTPTCDGDRVYSISKNGDLFCLDAAKGDVVWSQKLASGLGFELPTWGFAGSPLIVGDMLVMNVGHAGTAFDKVTGRVIWKSAPDAAGYSTPVLFESEGRQLIAMMGSDALNVVELKTGKLAWSFPWATDYKVNAADPIILGDHIFISSGYNHGAAMLKISGGKPAVLWQTKNMRSHFSNSVVLNNYLYGADENELRCIDLATGEVKWKHPEFGKGTLMMAGGKLICMGDKGMLLCAEATPEAFKPISRAQVLGGKCWSVPVLANGKIYCRNVRGDVVCLDVSAD